MLLREYNNGNNVLLREYNNGNNVLLREYNNVNNVLLREYNNVNNVLLREYILLLRVITEDTGRRSSITTLLLHNRRGVWRISQRNAVT